MREYWVYMLTNGTHRVLYTGVTNNLARRLHEHQQGEVAGFTQRYRTTKLVYAEASADVLAAIAREKQIKGWLRKKKNELVASINPQWQDLGIAWNLVCHPERSEGSQTSPPDSSLRSE